MNEKIESIRNLIGEGEILTAIETLDQFLAAQKSPLRDDSLMIKSRFKKLERDKNLGLRTDPTEQNEIVRAALDLLKTIETEPKTELIDPKPTDFTHFSPKKPATPPPPASPTELGYVGRFWVDGDPFEYYLHQNGQIFRIDPATRTPFHVGNRFPSNDPRFAWTYHVLANNWWSSVDHQGVIWTINLYGMVVRVGQFQQF